MMETVDKPGASEWFRRVALFLNDGESPLRRRIRRRALSVHWYRKRRQVELLRELSELFRVHATPCAFVGGFAIDALQGAPVRPHSDIDVAFLDRDSEAVFTVLRRAGFRLRPKNPCSTGGWRKGLQVDLFHWLDAGNGDIQHVTSNIAVRMPESFLAETQEVEIAGVRFQIPSAEYLVSTLPFVQRPDAHRFLGALGEKLAVETDVHREAVQLAINATVHRSYRRT